MLNTYVIRHKVNEKKHTSTQMIVKFSMENKKNLYSLRIKVFSLGVFI